MTVKNIYIQRCACDNEDEICSLSEIIDAKKWTMHSAVYKSQDLMTIGEENPHSSQSPDMCTNCTIKLEDGVIDAETAKPESRTPKGQHYICMLSIKDNSELAKKVTDYFKNKEILVEVYEKD